MKKNIFLFFAILGLIGSSLLISNTSNAASYDPKVRYETITTDHFAINYSAGVGIDDVAQRVARICEEVHARLSPKINWKPWLRTQVVLLDSSDTVTDMASVLPYNWMSLRLAAPEADSSLGNYDDWLRMVITHEYTHILHLDKHKGFWTAMRVLLGKTAAPNGVVPTWYKEGFAVYEESMSGYGRNNSSYAEMLLRTAIYENKFPAIDEGDGVEWEWPGGYLPYIYGGKFLQYLTDKYGEESIYDFNEYISSSPLLFMTNRQAKKAFSKPPEFVGKKVHNRYVMEMRPGTEKSKNFYQLWKDWKGELQKKYELVKEQVQSEGETTFEKLVGSRGTITSPTISPDGTKIVFSEVTVYGPSELKMADPDGKNVRSLKKNLYANQISFSRDGSFIVYSKFASYKRYNFFSDLYKYDFETKKIDRLTKGLRARDPDVSPDGNEVVCVTQKAGSTELNLYNIAEKTMMPIQTGMPEFTQFSMPRFSPDGSKIAVTVLVQGRVWDVYVFDKKGKVLENITDSKALDRDPVWAPDGKSLYYVSDRSGISNIYRYNFGGKKTEKISNVLTGVFRPSIAPDGRSLIAQYYNGMGFDLRRLQIDVPHATTKPEKRSKGAKAKKVALVGNAGQFSTDVKGGMLEGEGSTFGDLQLPDSGIRFKSKKYVAFGPSLFLPRFVSPIFAYLDNSVLFGAYTGGSDPLKWNSWLGGVTYRTDANHFGYSFSYLYNRYKPTFNMGVMDYAVDFGRLTFVTRNGSGVIISTKTVHLFEKRLRGYGGVGYSLGHHGFGLNYFYEDRQPITRLTTAETNALNEGVFAGLDLNYRYGDSKKFESSISPEGGRLIKLGFDVTNSVFGAAQKNEQYIFAGDWREYIGLWGRQVLALKAAGGIVWGDQIRQGNFTLGGDLGEGLLATGGSLFYFPLRGLPLATLSRSRALLFSSEYRLPIVYVGRGLGTTPLFLNELHMAIFADYGNAWNPHEDVGKYFFDNFFLGLGAELRGNFVIGHGLPITGRLGYAIVVLNRDRIGTLTSPLTGTPAKDGMLVLQIGTSF